MTALRSLLHRFASMAPRAGKVALALPGLARYAKQRAMSAPEENLFAGQIGAEYDMLRLMCPSAPALAHRLGAYVGAWRTEGGPLTGFEIGCGTGISTLELLAARKDLKLTANDSAAKMLDQARVNLADYVAAGRVQFLEADALQALRALPAASVDLVASNYAIHNFLDGYRNSVISEIHRVLKPGGLFINGDRYAMDDPAAHLAETQGEVRRWFKLFKEMDRLDLLEDWVVHLFGDESADHIMIFTPSLERLRAIGFAPVTVEYRQGVDTLVTAIKPGA